MILGHVILTLRIWLSYRACVRQLSKLSDMELADSGLSRSGIHWVAWRTSVDNAAGKPSVHASNVNER
jgi:uncharacterized protein YjiS (DUF1127 family)